MPFPNFGFPYERPYTTQLELMNDIYQAIENRKIAFFESPTGTVTSICKL
jgi:Rad3-related DNA helicase